MNKNSRFYKIILLIGVLLIIGVGAYFIFKDGPIVYEAGNEVKRNVSGTSSKSDEADKGDKIFDGRDVSGQDNERFRESKIKVPILVYHHIDELSKDASEARRLYTVTPAMFKKQMQYLKDNDFKVITFSDLDYYFNHGGQLPSRAVIISFDDGWKSQYQNAFPVLKQYGFRAAFFSPTSQIVSSRMLMGWKELISLSDAGMEIGSHTINHLKLTKLSLSEVENEMRGSKDKLENKLGIPINIIAYPYGVYNSAVAQMASDTGYHMSRAIRPGVQQSYEERYMLKANYIYDNLASLEKLVGQ